MHQDGAIRRVLTPNIEVVDAIDPPENVGVGRRQRDRRLTGTGNEAAFLDEGAVVAAGQSRAH